MARTLCTHSKRHPSLAAKPLDPIWTRQLTDINRWFDPHFKKTKLSTQTKSNLLNAKIIFKIVKNNINSNLTSLNGLNHKLKWPLCFDSCSSKSLFKSFLFRSFFSEISKKSFLSGRFFTFEFVNKIRSSLFNLLTEFPNSRRLKV